MCSPATVISSDLSGSAVHSRENLYSITVAGVTGSVIAEIYESKTRLYEKYGLLSKEASQAAKPCWSSM